MHVVAEYSSSWALTADFTGMGTLQGRRHGQGFDGCLNAPICLEPKALCMTSENRVTQQRSECEKYKEFCSKAVYELPSTHLKITLPIMTQVELRDLYAHEYHGQADIPSPAHWRPSQQAQMILDAHRNSGMNDSGLTVVEMGCAAGWVLYNLKQVAGRGGKLTCFEADPHYHAKLNQTFQSAQNQTLGLSTELIPGLFTPGVLGENSVNIFTSSQTLEHFADPCPWLAEVYRVLKPGGLVFTEVPEQDNDPAKGLTRGQFHLLYFKEETFNTMMSNAGFERIISVTAQTPPGLAVRAIYRKPF